MIEEIGIIDTRKIINTIQENYKIDLSDYSLTSLKRRFINALEISKVNSIDSFITMLNDSTFFEKFLFNITINNTEMFRDPAVWRRINKIILPKIESQVTFKIWLPDSASGEELYSLCILLKENDLLDKVKIYASNISSQKIDFIKAGVYRIKREDIDSENYSRTKGLKSLSDYYTLEGTTFKMDSGLISNVEFIHSKSITDNAPEGIKLVIYRDSMIYLNKSYQNVIIDKISNSLLTGGYLIIGIKENLNSILAEKKFKIIDDSERIFQKIIA